MPRVESSEDLASFFLDDVEEFETGYSTPLLALFGDEFRLVQARDHAVEARSPALRCLTSDIAVHKLVKDSPIQRVDTGVRYLVKRIENEGHGVTLVRLK